MEAEGGKESDGGRRKGGREIEEGGREGGGAMEGGSNGGVGSKTSLTRARPSPVSIHACWLSFRGVFVSVRGRASSSMGIRFRLWAAGFVRGCAFQFGGTPVVGWWFVVAVRVAAVWWLVACRLLLWVV